MAQTVRDIMSAEVTTLGRNDTLLLAKDIMNLAASGISRSSRTTKCRGCQSARPVPRLARHGHAIRRKSPARLSGKRGGQGGHGRSDSISPDATVRDAARLMLEHKIGCLPVLEDSRLVGIVTETDMLQVVVDTA